MKNFPLLKKYGFLLAIVFLLSHAQTFAQLTYNSTWVANSGGTWKTFTQMYMLGAQVSKAGIVAGVTNWDEGGRGLGVYSSDNGMVRNTEWNDRGAGTCVGINMDYIYTAWRDGGITKRLVSHTSGAVKSIKIPGITNVSVNPYAWSYDTKTNDIFRKQMGITGVSANELFVVVAVYQLNKVFVYDTNLILLREFSVDRPYYATPDNYGHVWVIKGADSDNKVKVAEFNASGVATGKVIDGLSDPRSLQVNFADQLVIGDNGANQQVFFYDISGTPRLAKTVGQKGGIAAGIPGKVKPDKFNGIVYAGTDSLNNLYVITNREGAIIRKFSPENQQLWQKFGLAFVDMATSDPENENHIYSQEEKYVMDYTKENGQEQTYVACLLDPDKYPEDARVNQSLDGGVWIKYINGKKFMFVGNMYSDFIFIYRFNEASDGEIAIPSGAIMNHNSSQWGLVEWPAHQPKIGSFVWRDKNGNGKFDADEYESVPYKISLANVDDKANIYLGGSLDYFECMGIDEIGNPIYSFKNKIKQAIPRDFYLFKKGVYDNKRDVMYISGNSNSLGNDKNLGPVYAAYPDWSKGNKKAQWIKEYPDNIKHDYTSIAARSDYVFLGLALNNSNIDVLNAKTGEQVGVFTPQQLERFGWIDIPWGLMAEQRINGEYLVFREDDYVAKTAIQRWNPYSNDKDNPTKPLNIKLVSKTSTSATVSYAKATDATGLSGYFIYANGVRNNKLTVWNTEYTITGLLPDTDYDITVASADFAGHETSSDIVKTRTFPTDNIKPASPSGIIASEIAHTSFKLNWNTATDNIKTIGYNIFLDGQKIGYKLIDGNTFSFTGLMTSHPYHIYLVAYDYAGNVSDRSKTVIVTTLSDTQAPSTPKLLTTTQVSSSELAVIWTSSTDNVNVETYNLYQNGALLKEDIPAHEYLGITVSGNYVDYKITGLKPNTVYNLTVKAVDKSGNLSNASNTIVMKTDSVWSRLLDVEEGNLAHMGHNLYYDHNYDASGFVAGMMKLAGYIEWEVTLPTDTLYRFITRYVTMESQTHNMQIEVNGENAHPFTLVKLPGMTSWGVYDHDPGYIVLRLKAGKNTIRLSSYSSVCPNLDLVKIKIAAPPASVASVILGSSNVSLFIKEKYQLTATVLPLKADLIGVKYESSANEIASVSETGLIAAKKVGTTTITVTTNDGSKIATCVVTVKNLVGISDNLLNNSVQTAAGNTFNGALAVALVEGIAMEDAVRFANAAAAISVTRLGAQSSVPARTEIEEFLINNGNNEI